MKAQLCALAAFLILSNQTVAQTHADPRALKLLAQAKAAAGGVRLNRLTTFYNAGTRVRDGKTDGVYQEWGDYRTMAYTNIETFDGKTSTSGFDGKSAWQLGDGGKVEILPDGPPSIGTKLSGYLDIQGYFFPERFPATFSYIGVLKDKDVDYDVVTASPSGMIPIELWFDRKNHLLNHIGGKLGSTSIRGDLLQYERVDGVAVMRNALQTATTQSGVHTESQNVAVYQFKPVAAERISMPK